MAIRRILCLCGTLLTRDERDHYVYQCTLCVSREHELIAAHHRGEAHDEIDAVFDGPVDLGLAVTPQHIARRTRRAA